MSITDTVLDVFRSHPGRDFDATEIANTARGVSREQVCNAIANAHMQNKLSKTRRGRYTLADDKPMSDYRRGYDKGRRDERALLAHLIKPFADQLDAMIAETERELRRKRRDLADAQDDLMESEAHLTALMMAGVHNKADRKGAVA